MYECTFSWTSFFLSLFDRKRKFNLRIRKNDKRVRTILVRENHRMCEQVRGNDRMRRHVREKDRMRRHARENNRMREHVRKAIVYARTCLWESRARNWSSEGSYGRGFFKANGRAPHMWWKLTNLGPNELYDRKTFKIDNENDRQLNMRMLCGNVLFKVRTMFTSRAPWSPNLSLVWMSAHTCSAVLGTRSILTFEVHGHLENIYRFASFHMRLSQVYQCATSNSWNTLKLAEQWSMSANHACCMQLWNGAGLLCFPLRCRPPSFGSKTNLSDVDSKSQTLCLAYCYA